MSNTIPARKVKRPGAGRTKGSFSFVKATMAQMIALNPNPDFQWLLSRKQIEALGGSNFVTDTIGGLKDSLAGQSVETTPEVKTEEL